MTTVVPELLAKKRKRDEQAAALRAAAALESRKKSRNGRKEIFKRAEKYVAEYRSQVQLGGRTTALSNTYTENGRATVLARALQTSIV